MKKKFIFGLIASSAMILTSCLDSTNDSTTTLMGYGTVDDTMLNQVVIRPDYNPEASISLSSQSSKIVTDAKAKRLFYYVEYSVEDVTGSLETGKFSIKNAELCSGSQKIPLKGFNYEKEAVDFDWYNCNDSINEIMDLNQPGLWNGYLTFTYRTKMSYASAEDAKSPTLRLVLEPTESNAVWNAKLLLNRHGDQEKYKFVTPSGYDFRASFDISSFALKEYGRPEGLDKITFNFIYKTTAEGDTKTVKYEIPVADMFRKY